MGSFARVRPAPAAWLLLPLAIACIGSRDRSLRAYGTVEARAVEISSRSPGRVLEVLVDDGDSVQAGQPLVRLDMADLEGQRAQAAGTLAVADAQLRLLEAGSRAEDVAAARQALVAARDRLAQAERDLARAEALVRQQALAPATEENARTVRDVASADVRSADEALRKLVSGARAQEIEAAAGNRAAAQATLERLDDLLRDRTLSTPVDGVILHRLTEPGEVILPGVPLIEVGEIGRPWIDVYVPEPRVGEVKPGADVQVRLDAFPKQVFPGRVSFVASEAEFTPKNVQTADQRARLVFRVRVDVFEGQGRLLPGMPGEVRFEPPGGT